MDKMKTVIAAAIVAVGIVVLGFCIKAGLGSFLQNQRVVTVKGLAVREVKANKVIWPIVFKELGDDLPGLYNRVDAKNQIVKKFLRSNGIEDSEISTNVVVTDLQADSYSSNLTPYRYRINSVVTVNTKKVDTVLKLIENQSSLIEQGVAISFDYSATTQFDFTDLNTVKPEMIKEATQNARKAAMQFAADSESSLGKIKSASQGQFSIDDRDQNTPYIKEVRVVTTIEYMLED